MKKFKLGDKVRCIESNARKGYGWRECLEFTIDKIIPADDYAPAVYFPGNDGHGVYGGALELVEEKINFKRKGTKLPDIPKGTPFRCENWYGNDQGMMKSYTEFISYGESLHEGKEYILTETPEYEYSHYFMIPLSEIERLAKEQNMIKETVKKLPKSFAIFRDENNPLWKKYIAWLNEKYDHDLNGQLSYYYGITKTSSKYVNLYPNSDHFDQIITLEEWNEIVNGKQEKQNKMEITRKQLKNIHDVACSTWKTRIETEYATRNPWGDTIEFTQKEIVEMFKAADSKQTKVLEAVFGKQHLELDLRSDDINLKVDELPVFGRSCDRSHESLIGLPIEESTKNVFFLNKDYEWVLKGNRLTVTRK